MNELAAFRQQYQQLLSLSPQKAEAVLHDEAASATALYAAAHAYYGADVASFDPDTLWLLLDVPPANRDKLMAAITLQRLPSFFWDYRVFGNTVLALAGQPVFIERTPQPSPADICWGVFEAQLLFQIDSDVEPEFDAEIASYVAAAFLHEGYVALPPLLDFAATALTELLDPEHRALAETLKKEPAYTTPADEESSTQGVQRAHQARLQALLDDKLRAFAAQLARYATS